MTALIRIAAGLWLILAFAVIATSYTVIWLSDGTTAVAAAFGGGGPLGLIGMACLSLPGILLLIAAGWLDRRRGPLR